MCLPASGLCLNITQFTDWCRQRLNGEVWLFKFMFSLLNILHNVTVKLVTILCRYVSEMLPALTKRLISLSSLHEFPWEKTVNIFALLSSRFYLARYRNIMRRQQRISISYITNTYQFNIVLVNIWHIRSSRTEIQFLKRKWFKEAGPSIFFCEEIPVGEGNIQIPPYILASLAQWVWLACSA